MSLQIIHCPTDAEMRKEGFYGSTWLIEPSLNLKNWVHVQYSVCSPDDQFSRKKGVQIAKQKIAVPVHKADLIEYINHVFPHDEGMHFTPSTLKIYQAVIRL